VAMAALAAHCTQLTSLRLEQTYVGDEGVHKVLTACPLLQELRVAGCSTHSWMLPAEYMFAGLSVSGLSKMAAVQGVGSKLTSLDLSCLAYEQQQEQLAVSELLLPAAAAAAAVAAAAVAAVGAGPAAEAAGAAAAGSSVAAAAAAAAAALLATSPEGSSHSSSSGIGIPFGADSSSSPGSSSSISSAVARLSLDSNSDSDRASSCSPEPKKPWGSSEHGADDIQQLDCDQNPGFVSSPLQPLIPADWCARLSSLSLDWLKVDGAVLQQPLQATLRCCNTLTRLSLIGYHGDVDALLPSVADAGAPLSHLNLQHSQVCCSTLTTSTQGALSLQLSCTLVGVTGSC